MNLPRLSRSAGQGRPAAPVRLVHLGLGNFFRAHQCWYTQHVPDAAHWGIAAFSGTSSPPLVDDLNAQEGLYTLVSRAADADQFEVLSSLSRAHVATDQDAWLRYFGAPELAAVTITVTEAGYLRGPDGGLDTSRPAVQADIEALFTHGGINLGIETLAFDLGPAKVEGTGKVTMLAPETWHGEVKQIERVRDRADVKQWAYRKPPIDGTGRLRSGHQAGSAGSGDQRLRHVRKDNAEGAQGIDGDQA